MNKSTHSALSLIAMVLLVGLITNPRNFPSLIRAPDRCSQTADTAPDRRAWRPCPAQ